MDYTVIGDSVNLAARLEGANKYYGTKILLSEFTVKQLKGQNRLREIDFIRVKGKREPIAIFEALDYHNENTFPHMDKAIEEFHTGLKNYRKRDWEWALVHFGRVLELNPKDRPASLYMDRCRKYMESSPDSSWDGVWTMTQKK